MRNKNILTLLGNIALLGAHLGPLFVHSEHGQQILAATEGLVIAELQLLAQSGQPVQVSAPTVGEPSRFKPAGGQV